MSAIVSPLNKAEAKHPLSVVRISPADFWALLGTFTPEGFASEQWSGERWVIFQLDHGRGVAVSIAEAEGERAIHHFVYERHHENPEAIRGAREAT